MRSIIVAVALGVIVVLTYLLVGVVTRTHETNFQMGLNAYRAGRFDKAIEFVTKHIENDYRSNAPTLDYAYMFRAQIENVIGKYEAAIEDGRKALEHNPYSIYSRIETATAYAGLKRWDAAFTELDLAQRRIEKSDREDPSIFLKRGEIYEKMGDMKSAEDAYTTAIKIDPMSVVSWMTRGHYYTRLKSFENAVEDYSEAIRLAPDNRPIYNSRAAAYMQLGKIGEAAKDQEFAR